jgi:hypothetical protein
LCHGKTHPHRNDRPICKPDVRIWESAIYVDSNKYVLPDVAKPVTDLSKSTFKEKFDAVIAMYCPFSAYIDKKTKILSSKFFRNIASWLKPGGVYIMTGLPSNLFPILNKSNKDLETRQHNALLYRLIDLKFSKSKTDQKEYESHRQFIRSNNDPDLQKLMNVVEKEKDKRMRHTDDYYEITEKEEKKVTKIFLKKVHEITDGKLVPVKKMITNDSIVFRRNP